MANSLWDVIVLGGGPAGSVVALILAQQGYRVLILEKTPSWVFKPGESLSPNANPLLNRLGVTLHLQRGPHLPSYGNQSAWGSSELLDNDFLLSPYGHGWHLDRLRFDQLLLDLAQQVGAHMQPLSRLGAIEATPKGWRLTWWHGSGRRIRTRTSYLVEATGLARAFLRQQRIPVHRQDRLIAHVVVLTLDRYSNDSDSRTLIESALDGWWYTARIPGNQRVVMYFTDAGDRSSHLIQTPDGLRAMLQDTIFVKQRVWEPVHGQAFPLHTRSVVSSYAKQVIGNRWLAVGDAALSFDPLSSQGIQTAMSCGERAAHTIAQILHGQGEDVEAYAEALGTIHRDYLEQRQWYYAQELRWRDRDFWKRRTENMVSGIRH